MIRAVKPTKMLVLNLNARLFALISITVFIAPPFVTKMNINDVLCKEICKKIRRFLCYMQLCPVSTVPTARQIARLEGCLKKKLIKKIWSFVAFQHLTYKPMMSGEQCSASA